MTKLKIFTAITTDYDDISKMHFRLATFCEDEAVHLISVQPVVTGPDLFVYVTYNDAVQLSLGQDQQQKRQVADAEELTENDIEAANHYIGTVDRRPAEPFEYVGEGMFRKVKEGGSE